MNKIITFFRESSLARFLIPCGLIFTICGIIFLFASIQNQDYIQTDAVISKVELEQEAYIDSDDNRVEATYTISVKYTVDGKEYEEELGGLPKYNIGDKMTIYYNPSNPSQITQTKSLMLPIIIIIGGVIALVSGIVSGINAINRYKKMKEQEKGWESAK